VGKHSTWASLQNEVEKVEFPFEDLLTDMHSGPLDTLYWLDLLNGPKYGKWFRSKAPLEAFL
jgi:hypothetical protein